MPQELRAGFGCTVVTPPLGSQMAGFDARKGTAESVHDELHARALVLDDGGTRAALISVELLGFDRPFADLVRREVEERTGIPAANIILSATHTHCGPVTYHHFFNQGQNLDEEYLGWLRARIVGAAEVAMKDLRPCRVLTGMAPVEGVAKNRRSDDGLPVDPYAGVVRLEPLDGSVPVVLVNYSCHPTVLGPNTLALGADFPGYAIRRIESLTNARAIFVQGAEGDLSMGHRSDLSAVGVIAPSRTFEKAEELGNRLGDAVLAFPLAEESGKVSAARIEVRLPLKAYGSAEEMRQRREQAAREVETAPEGLDLLKAKQKHLYSRIEEYYASLLSGDDKLDVELTAIGIGGTAIVSFPGEVFVPISLAIRQASPFARTLFAGLANDYIGYVPTADAVASVGYEVVAARVAPEAATVLRDEALELLKLLKVAATEN